jgi:hypothetical protein
MDTHTDIDNKPLAIGDRVYWRAAANDHMFGTLRAYAERLQSFTVAWDDGTTGMMAGNKLTKVDVQFMATDEYKRATMWCERCTLTWQP